MLRIGITGQGGFIGTHLANFLQFQGDLAIVPFRDGCFAEMDSLQAFVAGCDAIVHLAAVNRHDDPSFLYATNVELAQKLIAAMRAAGSRPHVVYASSTQEDRDTPYGRSKRAGRAMLSAWAAQTGATATSLIIPNVYGPFGRPQYNSVVATFCHQLARGQSPNIIANHRLKMIYVGELVEFISHAIRHVPAEQPTIVPATAECSVSELLATLTRFRDDYAARGRIPRLANAFELNLFRTFQCYMETRVVHPASHADDRGTLAELLKTGIGGQVSFSTTRPQKTRGGHFHTRKLERFMVVQGNARVRLRRVARSEVVSLDLSGDEPAFVDIPIWHAHDLTNTGERDLITVFWTSEAFDPADPDTFSEPVEAA